MAYNLITKETREKSRIAQIDSLINRGYKKVIYKTLTFLYKEETTGYYLQCFKDGAAHPLFNYRYKDGENMFMAIEKAQEQHDRREAWKIEQKKDDKLRAEQIEAKAAAGEIVQASTAKSTNLLKKMLKEKFNINATVRSEKYSMGCSLNVEYTLGIEQKEVENILNQLQYGRFDGMTDCSYSVHSAPLIYDGYKLEEFKHVFVRQNWSDEFNLKLIQFWLSKMKYGEIEAPKTVQEMHANNPKVWEYEQGSSSTSNFFYRRFKVSNFATQDETKVNLIDCKSSERSNGEIYFIYEVDGVQYNTEDVPTFDDPQPTDKTTQPKPSAVETKDGEVKIIAYSEKAIAVVGSGTKLIKDTLKSLGGSFNFRLSCGAGWIFPKSKLQEVTSALKAEAEKRKQAHQGLQEEVETTLNWLAETDVKIFGNVSPSVIEAAKVQNVSLTLLN